MAKKFNGRQEDIRSCPKCGARCSVIDSRRMPEYVRRRIVCAKGHRHTTVEQIVVVPVGPVGRPPSQSAKLFTEAGDRLAAAQKEFRIIDRAFVRLRQALTEHK